MNPNQEIYEKNYSGKNMAWNRNNKYDMRMVETRLELLKRYVPGKDVLDLGCGSGDYLREILPHVRSAIGLDFSENLLQEFRSSFGKSGLPVNLNLVHADAADTGLPDASIDVVFSFCALYHIPNVEQVIKEISRVLRPNGIAILEFGNFWSVNTAYSYLWHKSKGWARPFHVSVPKIRSILTASDFNTLSTCSFQLFPLYRAPKKLIFLDPFLGPQWKPAMSWRPMGSRSLDELISSLPLLKHFSFRKFFVVEKRSRL